MGLSCFIRHRSVTDLGSDDLDGFEEHRSGIFRMSLSLGPSTVLLMVGLGRVTLKKSFYCL